MQRFNDAVKKTLGFDATVVGDTATPNDIPDWDSMNYLLLISELEKAYAVSFTMDEVLGAQNLGDLKKLLVERGALS